MVSAYASEGVASNGLRWLKTLPKKRSLLCPQQGPWILTPSTIRNTPSTAGNSMTGSGRPSPEPLLKKKRPQPYWGGDNSGNALEASNALNYRPWGIPAVLSTGIPGNALRAFPGSFRNFSGISSGKSQPYWGYGPYKGCDGLTDAEVPWRRGTTSPGPYQESHINP